MKIKDRHSIRKYDVNHEVSKQVIEDILDAGMHAPSARNLRPWHFTVIRSRKILDDIATMSPYMKMMKEANFAIMVYAKESYDDVLNSYIPQDSGAAIENMLLEALEHDLGSCWCGIFPNQERVKVFKDYFKLEGTPIAMIAFGKPLEDVSSRGFYEASKVNYLD